MKLKGLRQEEGTSVRAKKLVATLLAALMMGSSFSTTYAKVLHEVVTAQTVTSGVEHISKEVLTSSGWQDINILRIDLSNENVVLKTIDSNALGQKETILDFANSQGAVAAVNGDFFDMSTSTATAFGPVVKDGEIRHAYNSKHTTLGPNKSMGTFIVDEDDNPMMGYYSVALWAETDDQKLFDISGYNKMIGSLNTPMIIDQTYYANNQTAVNKFKGQGVFTVIVENDEITYVSQKDEVVNLPQGACAIILNEQTMALNMDSLQVGETLKVRQEIRLNNEVVSSIDALSMTIGGGGLIMKDGRAYNGEAHKVSGDKREPRTVVATTNNPNEVLLVTVDGRGVSIGANHQDLIQILQGLGVKDAMYLDGGGSTTLVARDEATTQVKVQNKPSGGAQRKVTNGIGVFSTASKGELAKISIEPSRERTFVGEGIGFELKGVDENSNPITQFEDKVSVSVAGVTGTWKGLTFYPDTEGTALVMASVGDVTGTTEIQVTKPTGILIEPSNLQMEANTTKQIQLYGVDRDGYKVPISADKVKWTSTTEGISAKGNQVTSTKAEVGTLTASYQGIKGNLGVIVGETVMKLESFEENTAKWAGTGSTVTGKVEASKDIKYHGDKSLKMTYTFDKDTNRQVGYTVFNQPITIPADARSINMWVNARGQGDTMKIQVEDAKGTVHYLKAVEKLDFDGWKYISIPLPENMAMPAKFTKLYVYADGNKEKRTSAVYIDHISMTRGSRSTAGITTRADYLFDPMYKPSLDAPHGDQYQIKVTGPTAINGMKLSSESISSMSKELNNHSSRVIQASSKSLDLKLEDTLTYNNQFKSETYQDVEMIMVGTESGGIRTTNEEQWDRIKNTLQTTTANHVMLVMSHNPITQFNDAREGKALHDYLVEYKKKTGKDVFVITTGGMEKDVRIEEGIRYIRLNGLAVPTDDAKQGEYLTFKVVGDNIYYTFKPMI